MKWLLLCSSVLFSGFSMAMQPPQTVSEIDIQIEYLQQQRLLLKKRFQSDTVYHHKSLTKPALNMGAREQENRYQSHQGDHLQWLAAEQAKIDSEIVWLKRQKTMLQEQVSQPVAEPQALNSAVVSTQQTSATPTVSAEPFVVSIIVPRSKIAMQGEQAYVQVSSNGEMVVKEVSLGSLVGDDFVQILSGLQLGETLLDFQSAK